MSSFSFFFFTQHFACCTFWAAFLVALPSSTVHWKATTSGSNAHLALLTRSSLMIPLFHSQFCLQCESTLQWSKIVVTNTTFWNYMFLNFYQTNIKRVFTNGTWNKVTQNPNNKILKENHILKFMLYGLKIY